jgi:release factor glutamine methyltransferase
MTIREATYYLLNKLKPVYGEGEAGQLTDMAMEYITGSGKTERMLYKNEAITGKEEEQVMQFTTRLLLHEPVQYILEEAWFGKYKFYVDKNVLIPRPETEELVEWIIEYPIARTDNIRVLDIGTGSGCIPISLKKRMPAAEIWAIDISEGALEVAKRNAATIGAEINFLQLDILDPQQWTSLPVFDIIVSNPPYIPEHDKAAMLPNVLQYEPSLALFVPDEDALLFYKAIAAFAKEHLRQKGWLYFEIHEDLGEAVAELLRTEGFSTELKKDMQQKDRMVKSGLL